MNFRMEAIIITAKVSNVTANITKAPNTAIITTMGIIKAKAPKNDAAFTPKYNVSSTNYFV